MTLGGRPGIVTLLTVGAREEGTFAQRAIGIELGIDAEFDAEFDVEFDVEFDDGFEDGVDAFIPPTVIDRARANIAAAKLLALGFP